MTAYRLRGAWLRTERAAEDAEHAAAAAAAAANGADSYGAAAAAAAEAEVRAEEARAAARCGFWANAALLWGEVTAVGEIQERRFPPLPR